MKVLFAAGLSILSFTALLSAQIRGLGALGGSPASQVSSRPLGGIAPPSAAFRFGANQASRGRYGARPGVFAFPYTYSVYVPSYFDTLGDSGYYPPAAYPPPPAAAGNPPVIINQYFSAPGDSGQGFASADQNYYSSPQPPPVVAGAQAGDAIGTPQNYYLIAYKDHSVYSVLAYWLEGDTLNYVTTQNTHNQASLNLIDLDLTKQLNQNRNLPFSLPGR